MTSYTVVNINSNFNDETKSNDNSCEVLEDIEETLSNDVSPEELSQEVQSSANDHIDSVEQKLNCDNMMSIPEKDTDELPICRICHCHDDSEIVNIIQTDPNSTPEPTPRSPHPQDSQSTTLITPCFCSGSLRYVHHYCLQQWIRSSNHKYCELCKFHFKLTVKSKPLHKWESLEMSASERRKLVCNLVFNLISMFCVFWSIYVLIERATIEARYGMLEWPFWTKMLVVTIGFLGGTIFLFVQLRLYISIILRWRQYNRIIIIENAPLKDKTSSQDKSQQKAITISTISNGQLQK